MPLYPQEARSTGALEINQPMIHPATDDVWGLENSMDQKDLSACGS